ncbi:MAG TPA: endolytic transglycosylase MltG, partial [Candidatus Binatia bacterium]|nr:endolytic transglycosylase MltG [Candidatus Binatia bacterium]
GYLFPNTYHLVPPASPREVILKMTEQFRNSVELLGGHHREDNGLTPHEVVTLASMIEKETGVEAERPLVSAVFHNRLRLKMPLQSDPTVIYGLKDFNGNLTRKDLNTFSPYNTYRIPALPPGPICNPGLSSLKAALFPAPVKFLYFVSKNDGTHHFSENLEAHSQAVKTYQSRTNTPASRRKVAVPHH